MSNAHVIITTATAPANTLMGGCEVCHRIFPHHELIAVCGIPIQSFLRVTPWYICPSCATIIHDAWEWKKANV